MPNSRKKLKKCSIKSKKSNQSDTGMIFSQRRKGAEVLSHIHNIKSENMPSIVAITCYITTNNTHELDVGNVSLYFR